MPVYPEEIASAVREPKFYRPLEEPNAIGAEAKLDCGCFIRIEMRIDGAAATIGEIGYRTNGCGYMIAAAEAVSSMLSESSLLDLQGDVEIEALVRPECSSAVARAVKNGFADHLSQRIEEFGGEKALICTCFGVTEETIEQFVRTNDPSCVSQVSECLRAGSGCGSCRMLIQEIIDANR